MMFVTKFDGRKQEFQKEKIVRTCLRMHASSEQAEEIAERIERKIYDGIPTREILKLIFDYLKEYKPETEHKIDLKEAISLLRAKPDFEKFVQLILKELGYDVFPNQYMQGRCVEYEVDAIAKKENKTFLVEVKHHINHHSYTGIDVCLETQARLEDLREGFDLGLNSVKFDGALIVCNTKFSEHAKKYAYCKGIELIGWKTPEEKGLEQTIEEKKFYPITFIKGLDRETQEKLCDNGIILVQQLVKFDVEELYKKTKIPKKKLRELIRKAKEILS
jgi:Holliday junction resolvase-like predicted endonuclease